MSVEGELTVKLKGGTVRIIFDETKVLVFDEHRLLQDKSMGYRVHNMMASKLPDVLNVLDNLTRGA